MLCAAAATLHMTSRVLYRYTHTVRVKPGYIAHLTRYNQNILPTACYCSPSALKFSRLIEKIKFYNTTHFYIIIIVILKIKGNIRPVSRFSGCIAHSWLIRASSSLVSRFPYGYIAQRDTA